MERKGSGRSEVETVSGATELGIAVVTVSDTRTVESDTSGAVLVEFCTRAGHALRERRIVVDDEVTIRELVVGLVARPEIQVVILTGGTGVTRRDVTPEAIRPLLDKEIVGFGELFRFLSYAEIGASTIQSRALAGVSRGKLIFALPGSTGAVRLAVEKILQPQLDRATRPCNFVELLPRL